MSQINRSELALVALAHLCPLQGLSVLFGLSQEALQCSSLVMMDKPPWSAVCQSDAVPAYLHPCCTLERCVNRLCMPLQWTQPLAYTNSSSQLLFPYCLHLKLCLSANICIMHCLSCWSVMKTQVAALHLKQGTDWVISPNTLMLVSTLDKGICIISLIQGLKM